jgi:peptide deformylase
MEKKTMEIVSEKTEEKREVAEDLKLSPPEEVEGAICEEIKEEEYDEIFALTEKMIVKCVMLGGVGLSAPQVGIKKKMFVFMFKDDMYQAAINPRFYPEKRASTNLVESCLTYGTKRFFMKRYKNIRVVYYTINRQEKKLMKVTASLRGMPAYVFQHELDHLDGKTIATEGIFISEK